MNSRNEEGHANRTWTEDNSGTHWLRDLLPSRAPFARILAYQYNANIVFGASAAGVEQQATNLLQWIWSMREV